MRPDNISYLILMNRGTRVGGLGIGIGSFKRRLITKLHPDKDARR